MKKGSNVALKNCYVIIVSSYIGMAHHKNQLLLPVLCSKIGTGLVKIDLVVLERRILKDINVIFAIPLHVLPPIVEGHCLQIFNETGSI